MRVKRSLLTHTIFVIPVLVILSSSFCLCLNPSTAMSLAMPCGSMDEGSRLLQDSDQLTCVKAAKVSIGDLTPPPKLTHTGKLLLQQTFTAQASSLNFDPHPFFAPGLSSMSHRSDPSVEIFTLNATYRL